MPLAQVSGIWVGIPLCSSLQAGHFLTTCQRREGHGQASAGELSESFQGAVRVHPIPGVAYATARRKTPPSKTPKADALTILPPLFLEVA